MLKQFKNADAEQYLLMNLNDGSVFLWCPRLLLDLGV